jgi:hypothetical protein
MTTQPSTFMRRALSSLVLLAVVIACLIPAGFMPGHGSEGEKFSIVICTSMGIKTIEVDGGGDTHDSGAVAPLCAYAPVLAQDIPVPLPSPALNTTFYSAAHYTAIDVAEIATHRHVYTAQAPPQSFLI